jgi:hypothetical protein
MARDRKPRHAAASKASSTLKTYEELSEEDKKKYLSIMEDIDKQGNGSTIFCSCVILMTLFYQV